MLISRISRRDFYATGRAGNADGRRFYHEADGYLSPRTTR